VRALATALCTLPPMASGRSCPAAPGGSVRLVFAAGEQGSRRSASRSRAAAA
jgi:hypothetical protein